MTEEGKAKGKEYDFFKDSMVRYTGYVNEVGEAFRTMIPKKAVALTYVVASVYAVGDSIDKAYRAYHNPNHATSKKVRWVETLDQGIDTLIWQTAASVTLPAFAVNRTVKLTQFALNRWTRLTHSPSASKWIATAAGLSVIPFLPFIIDPIVDKALDHTTRVYSSYLKAKYVNANSNEPSLSSPSLSSPSSLPTSLSPSTPSVPSPGTSFYPPPSQNEKV